MQMIEQASKGYQALAVTGNATITWTNYTTANPGECGFLKLTGTLSSAATLTFPGNQNFLVVKNAAGATVTIMCSAGTGVAIPNGRTALIACDGTDYFDVGHNWVGVATTLTNSGDLVSLLQLQTAIAAASGLTAPFILNSAADTTPGYLGTKIAVAGNLTLTTQNAGANEKSLITHTPYWNTPRALASTNSPITAVANDILLLTTDGAITVNLPTSGRVKIADISGTASSNNITLTPNGADTVTFGTIDTNYFGGEYYRNGTNWVLT